MARRFTLFTFHVSLFLAAAAASAQVAPSILIEPWPTDPIMAQSFDQVIVTGSGDVDQDGTDTDAFVWDSYGRIKFDRNDQHPSAVIGYRILNLDINADRRDLNGTYNDLAIVGGFQLGQWGDWKVAAIAGAGSANDGHWDVGESYYGIGAVHLSREMAPGETLHMGVSYDGNRTFLPDVPLPYVSYVNATDPNLVWVVGLPVSSVTWKPGELWVLSLRYMVPYDFAARASYTLSERWSLFAEYEKRLDAFHEHDAARDDRRLFYERSFAAAGVRYQHPWADVSLAAGYMFDQEYSRGWDTRDADTAADIDGVPMVMLVVRGTF